MRAILYPEIYTKYIGRPLYKLARKAGMSKIAGIYASDIPGSIAVGLGALALTQHFEMFAIASLAHEVAIPPVFYFMHRKHINLENRCRQN